MIVSADWLHHMLAAGEVAVIDVRYKMGDPKAGQIAYEKEHIPGAVYLDMKKHLAGPIEKHGGENPLPDPEELAETLGELGIDRNMRVIVYDTANEMFSARAWWVLHYLGHDDVYILDGGITAWKQAGFHVTKQIPNPVKKHFKPKVRETITVDIGEVKTKLRDDKAILIDSRSYDRYIGKTEPLYHKAGHIPGAKNFFFKNVFYEDGTWKDKEQLEEVFQTLPKDAEIIVSCGSGISACVNVIGLKRAGYRNVKLYPGSFSDWISYEENELETRDES